jgi:hypothetical protein
MASTSQKTAFLYLLPIQENLLFVPLVFVTNHLEEENHLMMDDDDDFVVYN